MLSSHEFSRLSIPPRTPIPSPLAPSCVERTIGAKVALLSILSTDLAAKVLGHLHEQSAPDPVGADWQSLLEERLAIRGAKWSLTPRGHMVAQAIARDLAFKFKLHHIEFRSRPGTGPTAVCTCGQFSTVAMNTRNGHASVQRQANVHLSRVGQGLADQLLRSMACVEVRA